MRRHPLVRLVYDDASVHTAHDRDQPLCLEDPEGLTEGGARDAEPVDEIGFVAEGITLGELAGHDQGAELVGDLLGLLA